MNLDPTCQCIVVDRLQTYPRVSKERKTEKKIKNKEPWAKKGQNFRTVRAFLHEYVNTLPKSKGQTFTNNGICTLPLTRNIQYC